MHRDVLDRDFEMLRRITAKLPMRTRRSARVRALVGRVGLTAFAVAGFGGSVQAGPSWQRLSYSDPRHPGPLDATVLSLWHRELTGKPFYQVHAARFENAGTTYLVSLAFAGGLCTMGANDRNAVAEPAICPVRVDVIQAGTIVKTVRSKVCSVAPLPEDTTADQTDATEVTFDPASKVVGFRSRLNGRWVRLCQRQVKVR